MYLLSRRKALKKGHLLNKPIAESQAWKEFSASSTETWQDQSAASCLGRQIFSAACFQCILPSTSSQTTRVKCTLTTDAQSCRVFTTCFIDYKVEQQRVKVCPKVSGAEPRGQIKLDENAGKVK